MTAFEVDKQIKDAFSSAITELETLQNQTTKGSTLFNFLVQQIIGFKYYRNPFENGKEEQRYFRQLLIDSGATTEELNLLLIEEEDLVDRYKETILSAIKEQTND